MKRPLSILFAVLLLAVISNDLFAQDKTEIKLQNEALISKLLDRQSGFGMFRDNYIITGIPINQQINQTNADIKFQVSIRQRLLSNVMPFGSFLMLTYTQKSFWNFYEESHPFADNNYNPGLSLGKPIMVNNQLKGMALFAVEHESNGKDSTYSRGHNYFVLTGIYFFNQRFSVQGKLWAGFLAPENKDLYVYRGNSSIALNYSSLNNKFWASVVVNPRKRIGDVNTQVELSLRLGKRTNQYLFLQWYNGYGESLLDYNRYISMLRLGICLKPPFRNLY